MSFLWKRADIRKTREEGKEKSATVLQDTSETCQLPKTSLFSFTEAKEKRDKREREGERVMREVCNENEI